MPHSCYGFCFPGKHATIVFVLDGQCNLFLAFYNRLGISRILVNRQQWGTIWQHIFFHKNILLKVCLDNLIKTHMIIEHNYTRMSSQGSKPHTPNKYSFPEALKGSKEISCWVTQSWVWAPSAQCSSTLIMLINHSTPPTSSHTPITIYPHGQLHTHTE